MNNTISLIRNHNNRGVLKERLGSVGLDISDFDDHIILPGFTDVHVHLREPGFLYKETIATGTRAAAAGGFTNIFAMPNVDPAPDSPANLEPQLEAIRRDACVNVFPVGCITAARRGGSPADMEALAPYVRAFSDDGDGVMSDEIMLRAMRKAGELGRVVAAHCEDTRYPRESSEAEYAQVERDIDLAAKTGCAYHACHISTKESVSMIRRAKKDGIDVTCETAPHYLVLSAEEIKDDGRFKMNPPIKKSEDREALLEALTDGTIDMIATDHAPHSAEEKAGGFAESAYGIVGLETAFPVLYTKLVKKNIITIERLAELMSDAPNRRFGVENPEDTFTVWELEEPHVIDPQQFLSKGRSTPFEGWQVYGRCVLTAVGGKVVYRAHRAAKDGGYR